MVESKVEEIKEFLKEACNLETKIYSTEMIIDTLSKKRNYQKALTNINSNAFNNWWQESLEYKNFSKQNEFYLQWNYKLSHKKLLNIIFLIIGIVLTLIGCPLILRIFRDFVNTFYYRDPQSVMWLFMISGGSIALHQIIFIIEVIIVIAIIVLAIYCYYKFISEIKDYVEDILIIKKRNKLNTILYDAKNESFNKMLHIFDRNVNDLTKEIDSQNDALKSLKNELNTLYSQNIIHEKYRSLAPVYSLYEYFDTGRCSELVGPNGAYNLYEDELRHNLIIVELVNVNQNLENIKQNQFYLYKTLCDINSGVKDLANEINEVNFNIRTSESAITSAVNDVKNRIPLF